MITLRELPIAFRVLFSSLLVLIGIGYLTALSLLFLVDIEPHLNIGQSVVEDISEQYHGLPSDTRLGRLSRGQWPPWRPARTAVVSLNESTMERQGKDTRPSLQFSQTTASIRHNPQNNTSIPPLTSYDDIKKLLKTDTGQNIVALARVSHIHLFGISLIFAFTGAIIALSETPVWLRVTLVGFPYLTIIMDIGSWWLTKYLDPVFAYVVLIGGAGMGLALAAQIFISLWEMWIDVFKAIVGATGIRRSGDPG